MTSAIHQPSTRAGAVGSPLLRMSRISKAYGGVLALRGVDFDVAAGEVHALVGENGAGKSTLIRIIAGAETPDEGRIELAGEELELGDTRSALARGIAAVYQDPQLFPELTVVENIYLGRELCSRGRIARRAERAEAVATCRRLGIDPSVVDKRAGDLRVAEQQLVSIAKALARDPQVLILDEPSAILNDRDIEVLFQVVAAVREQGVGTIYISHRLDEITQIADRVTVLRDGAVVASEPVAGITVRRVAELMVGSELHATPAEREVPPRPPGPPLLRVEALTCGSAFRDVSFEIASGEIAAVYGLVGSGTEELAQSLFGLQPVSAGSIQVAGIALTPGRPRDAQRAGIALVPANRKTQAIFADKSIAFNLAVSSLRALSPRRRLSLVDRAAENRLARTYIDRLAVKAPGPATPISALSGGNQQKVVIGRQLATQPRVLVLHEPTQGVDVGAKAEIHRHIVELAEAGSAVLVVSTDLQEVLALADRLLVLRNGTIVREFARGAPSAEVLSAAAGESEVEQ